MATPSARPQTILTAEEYLREEELSPVKRELVDGRLYAFAGAGRRHNRIVSNLVTELSIAAGDGPCEVLPNDMLVRASLRTFYYPDVVVVCNEGDPLDRVIEDPCLLIEVLSPSTLEIDRREKLLAYQAMPSVRGCTLVYQDQRRVLHYWRDDDDVWWESEVTKGEIQIPCLDIELPLDRIYRGIRYAPEDSTRQDQPFLP